MSGFGEESLLSERWKTFPKRLHREHWTANWTASWGGCLQEEPLKYHNNPPQNIYLCTSQTHKSLVKSSTLVMVLDHVLCTVGRVSDFRAQSWVFLASNSQRIYPLSCLIFIVNLTHPRVTWEEWTTAENFFWIRLACGQVYAKLSWFLINAGGPSPL